MSESRSRVDAAAPSRATSEFLQRAVGDRYRIHGQAGEGGMATVFLAEDLKHHRKVAIKVLQETLSHTIGIRRFLQEIEVIAQLQHPHLLTLIDSGDVDGLPYYVMPYVEGQSLRELLVREKRLAVDRAVAIAREVADGLHFAHGHGVIHRDIKPSNILMSGGHAVVADFGIATALEKAAVGRLTETGISLGSPTYMSPEQAAAERDLDARTDIYSLGCVLYEMLSGQPPIDDPSAQLSVTRKLTGGFAPIRQLRPDLPAALEAAIHKALATARADRHASIAEFSAAVNDAVRPQTGMSRQRRLGLAAAAVLAIAALGYWAQQQRRIVRSTQRVPEIARLAAAGQYASAFALADEVSPAIPNDTTLQRLRRSFTDFLKIVTVPPGAMVSRRRLDGPDTAWQRVGLTPLDSVPMPRNGADLSYRLRLERGGYQTAEVLPHVFANWQALPLDTFRMDPANGTDTGMVWIPGWSIPDSLHPRGGPVLLSAFHIGRTEVTNREYKEFVNAGGYEKREFWTEPFVRDGKAMAWQAAMALFRDRSGLPGPSNWVGGSYPEGQADYPVGGVSYYEAAAFARFAGKRLPSTLHWAWMMRHGRMSSWIYIPTANLNSTGPRPVGQGRMNAHGVFDAAGNVREWQLNVAEGGRATRGGSWKDAEFHVGWIIPKPDFDRSADNGFRLMKTTDADSTLAHVSGRVTPPFERNLANERPVSPAEVRLYTRLFDYDPGPLDARRDTGGVSEHYRWERVSFNAAYGGERMAAYVFLPKHALPPYQPIVLWSGSGVMSARSFDPNALGFARFMGFLPRSGRALVFPVIKGSFDRDDSAFNTLDSQQPTRAVRDLHVMWVKDFRRTVDYLESRSDIASKRVGYYGYSFGGRMAPIVMVVEPRVTAAVLNVGGVVLRATPLPEADAFNYLPSVRTPTLMLNGRHDIVFPYHLSQLPFYRLLGTPAADKRHFVYPSGHDVPQEDMVRETLAWFDKYLGPTSRAP